MPRLTLHPGDPAPLIVELKAGRTVLGRSEECAIQLADDSISRQHAEFIVTDGRTTLRDLKSANGTSVDGRAIEEVELRGGELLEFGTIAGSFEADLVPPLKVQPTMFIQPDRRDPRLALGTVVRSHREASAAGLLGSGGYGRRPEDKLQLLLDVTGVISMARSVEELLPMILDLLLEITGVDRVAILLVDPESGELVPREVRGRAGGRQENLAYSRSVVNYVLEHDVAAVFPDTLSDERLSTSKSVVRQLIASCMCVPVKAGGEALGVLYVDSRGSDSRFTDDDLQFLSTFAYQAAMAIENATLQRQLEQEAVRRSNLLQFFPPSVAGKLMESPASDIATIDAQVTALFCDISGFTALSERLGPRGTFELLNCYLPAMSAIVFRHEGTLEKYIGDALLAVWGAPYPHDDDADRAVRAAIDMQRAIHDLRSEWPNGTELQVHVGINSGHVAAGNLGSGSYIQYATIGDATNVAARICGLAHADEIVLAASTHELLRSCDWPLEERAAVQLRGRDVPVVTYRLDWRPSGRAE